MNKLILLILYHTDMFTNLIVILDHCHTSPFYHKGCGVASNIDRILEVKIINIYGVKDITQNLSKLSLQLLDFCLLRKEKS